MKEVVGKFRRSGKSQSQFCKDEGIKPHVLWYWTSKGAGAQRGKRVAKAGVLPFVEITPAQGEAESATLTSRVEVMLPEGAMVRVFGPISEANLSAAIRAAKRAS